MKTLPSDEEIQAILGIGPDGKPLSDQEKALQLQLSRAQALMDQKMPVYHGALAAGLGSLSHILDAYTGKRDQDNTQARLEALSKVRGDAAINNLKGAYRDAGFAPAPNPTEQPPPGWG